jgi:hypothetical protein
MGIEEDRNDIGHRALQERQVNERDLGLGTYWYPFGNSLNQPEDQERYNIHTTKGQSGFL